MIEKLTIPALSLVSFYRGFSRLVADFFLEKILGQDKVFTIYGLIGNFIWESRIWKSLIESVLCIW